MLHRSPATRSAGRKRVSGPLRLDVVSAPGGWQVRRRDADRATSTFATEAEAVDAAQKKLASTGGELRIQRPNGRWKQNFTLGGVAMAKLAAVEGIVFTPTMKRKIRRLQDFEKDAV